MQITHGGSYGPSVSVSLRTDDEIDYSLPLGSVAEAPPSTPLLDTALDAIRVLQEAMTVQQESMSALQAEMQQLKLSDQTQNFIIVGLHETLEYMPCPNGMCTNLPADGWTGKPIDAPDAVLMSIEQCMAAGGCNCAAGAMLAVLPIPNEVAPS